MSEGPKPPTGAEPTACVDCLRRSQLLALLGPYVEKVASSAPGKRTPELLSLSNEDLVAAAAPNVAGQLLEKIAALPEVSLRRGLREAECWACCRHADAYPAYLRDAADAPWALIGRGDARLLGDLEPAAAVTVVGSRRASGYGRAIARQLARELTEAGMLVISGLAFGIDSCAHRGALEAGPTLAVLGCGADVAYPATHRSLWRRICERGAVVSELPPGAPPWKWTFPARNRVMAALAGMTVVVEAAERSGSLITADIASDLGRDLGAVPGMVTARMSAGPNSLLAGGACVVRGAQDVLDAMLGAGVRRLQRLGPVLDADTAAALEAVEEGAVGCDAVALRLGLGAAEAAAALTRLELMGYLSCSPLGTYSRTTLRQPGAGVDI